jgi:haloalkane dehalogenase
VDFVRTPDQRFDGLPDFNYAPRYRKVTAEDGTVLRMAFVDEGPRAGHPVLLLHGEPTWSFLYRRMIPPLADAGLRVIAPDLIGFGRSDKPTRIVDYSYAAHVEWLRQFVVSEDADSVTMFAQDWGGLLGLRVLAEIPDKFSRVMIANTGLPTGDHAMSDAFLAWQTYARETPDFPVGAIVARMCVNRPDPAVIAAYDAPFPDESFKAGARAFPQLVPTRPDDPASDSNRAAWRALAGFDRPFMTAFSDGDPITRGGDKPFRERVPGAAGQAHFTVRDAGHFLQEDAGEKLASKIIEFVAETRGF